MTDSWMLVAGMFGQSSGGSTFGTVKTQATISGAFSGGAGSVQSAGFGGFQKQPASSPGVLSAAEFQFSFILQKIKKPSLWRN